MEKLLGALAGFIFVILGIVIAIYIIIAIFLNKFNKLVYGKGTAKAWIPIFNIYLLGKLTVNKLVGWILVICIFLTGTYSTTVNGVESSGSILPENIRNIVSTIYGLAVFVLFIYAIIKYNNLKKEQINDVSQQTMQTSTQQATQTSVQNNETISQQQLVQTQEQNPNIENVNNDFNNKM